MPLPCLDTVRAAAAGLMPLPLWWCCCTKVVGAIPPIVQLLCDDGEILRTRVSSVSPSFACSSLDSGWLLAVACTRERRNNPTKSLLG